MQISLAESFFFFSATSSWSSNSACMINVFFFKTFLKIHTTHTPPGLLGNAEKLLAVISVLIHLNNLQSQSFSFILIL